MDWNNECKNPQNQIGLIWHLIMWFLQTVQKHSASSWFAENWIPVMITLFMV